MQMTGKKTRYQQVADRMKFNAPTDSLPPGLEISGATFFRPGDYTSKVIVGEYSGYPVAAFDFRANGEFGYTQTIVAMKSSATIKADMSIMWRISEIKCERLGEWIIFYREREEIAADGWPTFLEDCRRFVRDLELPA